MSNKIVVAIGAIALMLAGMMLAGTELAFSKDEDTQRESLDIARAEILAMGRMHDIAMRNARIANAEIWIKGNANEELTPVEEEIYAQLVYMNNQRFWIISENVQLLGWDQWKDMPAADFAGFLYDKPLAQRLWRERNDRLARYRGVIIQDETTTPGWRARVESALAEFEQ